MSLQVGDIVIVKQYIGKIVIGSSKDSLVKVQILAHYPLFNPCVICNCWYSKHFVKPYKPTIEELFKLRKAIDENLEPPF